MNRTFKFFNIFILILINLTVFLSPIEGYYDEDDEEEVSVYYYNGIPGCKCFNHCECYDEELKYAIKTHSCGPQDNVWHKFIVNILRAKKAGPNLDIQLTRGLVGALSSQDTAMFSDYLTRVEDVRKEIILSHEWSIRNAEDCFNRQIISKDRMTDWICMYNAQRKAAEAILDEIPDKIQPLYNEILKECYHREKKNVAFYYNRAMLHFIQKDYSASVDDLKYIFDSNDKLKSRMDANTNYLCGKSYLEGGLFHEAISALSEAIKLDPTHKEAYFDRAVAYFEIGDFDSCVADYIGSKKQMHPTSYSDIPFFDLHVRGLLKGLGKGGSNSVSEFVPTMLNTLNGVGCALWAFCESPLESTSIAMSSVYAFAEASYEVISNSAQYIKSLDSEKVKEIYSNISHQAKYLLEQFETIPPEERGMLIGVFIGEVGTDYFLSTCTFGAFASAKYGPQALEKLKNANRLCNLQKISNSPYCSNQIKTAALTQKLARDNYLKTIKIQWDLQEKHILGTPNYLKEKKKEINKSIITLSREDIITAFNNNVGRGQRTPGDMLPLSAGYRERVDFGKIIGKYTDGNCELVDTTMGIIHYGKGCAHIIPARPKGWITK